MTRNQQTFTKTKIYFQSITSALLDYFQVFWERKHLEGRPLLPYLICSGPHMPTPQDANDPASVWNQTTQLSTSQIITVAAIEKNFSSAASDKAHGRVPHGSPSSSVLISCCKRDGRPKIRKPSRNLHSHFSKKKTHVSKSTLLGVSIQ